MKKKNFVMIISVAIFFIFAGQAIAAESVGRIVLYEGWDPLTVPRVTTYCSNWWKPPIGGNMCIGHTYKIERLNVRIVATAKSLSEGQAKLNSALRECATAAVVSTAISAVVTGGGSMASLTTVMGTCMVLKIPDIYAVAVFSETEWRTV